MELDLAIVSIDELNGNCLIPIRALFCLVFSIPIPWFVIKACTIRLDSIARKLLCGNEVF